jgi:DNA-3-methyladenine glycosylase II
MVASVADSLTLAFRLDKTFEAVAVSMREEGESLVAECFGTGNGTAVGKQIARMLGLDADADAWLAVGARDPVVGRLQAAFPGFFTAAKASPYDAATWAIIAPRMGMGAAAKLKMAMAERHGDAVTVHGRVLHVFPSPEVLERLRHSPGLPEEKLERLRGIARAAKDGRLDADRLLRMSETEALSSLLTLRGVGPWAASHIYFRGAAPPDALPTAEPRVLHGLAAAYGLRAPSVETFRQMAEAWRPFRMWVSILLSRHLEREGGWHAPELARERAAAGRQLKRQLVKTRWTASPTEKRPQGAPRSLRQAQ